MNIIRKHIRNLELRMNEASNSSLGEFEVVRGIWMKESFNSNAFFMAASMRGKDGYYGLFKSKLLIDQSIEKYFINNSADATNVVEQPEYYMIYKTTTSGQDDCDITSVFNIQQCNSWQQLKSLAGYLIREDMQDKGPLYELSTKDNQENINLGYITNGDGHLMMIYLERKRPEKDKPREYHIHASHCPRKYKVNRNFLVVAQATH